ncbi:hypothetical protein H2203_002186 [Taxawa tesnikishii (nom. ined.)]|nr:hypothetical protein H2203_002186 [Dothideales sp. JES 119]
MTILSGSCWGGGGTVNWSASLQLQGFVRSQWAQSPHNLPYFTSAKFQADMDAVCERMGVGTASVVHNFSNSKLLEGARKLGMNAKTVPQNTGGKAHNCGYCTLGCGSCGKKGPTETFLPDAANAGAKFIEGFNCTRILFSSESSNGGNPVAIGVTGFWTSRDSSSGLSGTDCYTRPLTIKARKTVIIAAGALSTPRILQRSHLQNPHIGRHLRLHPVSWLAAAFDEQVRPWEGAILTAVVNDLENLDQRGHGVKLEATTMIPGLFLPIFGALPGGWRGGLEWKAFCAKMGRMTGYISLARDEGEGRVYGDKEGKIRVAYKVDKRDQRRIAQGIETLAKIMHVEGARELFVPIQGIERFERKGQTERSDEGVNNKGLQDWIETLRRKTTPTLPAFTSFASAHQMGTARMGASPRTSAVSPSGQVWGTKDLYIMDTSVFPSASGVNPMITGMGIAYGLAKMLAKDLTSETIAQERAKL